MNILFALLSGIFFSLWRRWFGGGFKETWLKNNRGVQTTVFILASTFILLHQHYSMWLCWLYAITVSVWLYSMYWSKGHGVMFDYGHGGNPTNKETQDRYNNMWGYKFLCWLFPTSWHHNFFFDKTLMMIRYTLPMLPLCVFNIKWIFVGLLTASVYGISWLLYDKNPEWFKNIPFAKYLPTGVSEYLVGFIFGLGIYLI